MWMFCSTRMSPERARYQSQLRRRYSSGEAPGWIFSSDGGRVVVAGDGADLAQRAGFDFLRDGGDRRRAAALEADIDALRGLDALGDLQRLLGLSNIDAHRLFAVDVLARGDRGFEVLHVEERRGGDLDQIDVLATRPVARMRADRGRAACRRWPRGQGWR